MADRKPTALQAAVQSDREARALAETDDAPQIQPELFRESSVFGQVKDGDGKPLPRGGRGRPRGPSYTTQQLVKLISQTGRHPILAMAEIVATPIDAIAKTLGCKKIEAAEYHRKVMSDLAPYVAQRLPQAVQVQGANAGMLVVNLGATLGPQGLQLDLAGGNGRAPGDALIVEGDIEENQGLGSDDDQASHGDPSHE